MVYTVIKLKKHTHLFPLKTIHHSTLYRTICHCIMILQRQYCKSGKFHLQKYFFTACIDENENNELPMAIRMHTNINV